MEDAVWDSTGMTRWLWSSSEVRVVSSIFVLDPIEVSYHLLSPPQMLQAIQYYSAAMTRSQPEDSCFLWLDGLSSNFKEKLTKRNGNFIIYTSLESLWDTPTTCAHVHHTMHASLSVLHTQKMKVEVPNWTQECERSIQPILQLENKNKTQKQKKKCKKSSMYEGIFWSMCASYIVSNLYVISTRRRIQEWSPLKTHSQKQKKRF